MNRWLVMAVISVMIMSFPLKAAKYDYKSLYQEAFGESLQDQRFFSDMTLNVNGYAAGELVMEQSIFSNERYVNGTLFFNLIENRVNQDIIQSLRTQIKHEQLALSTLEEAGMSVLIDDAKKEIRLSVKQHDLVKSDIYITGQPPARVFSSTLTPADWSGYMNMDVTQLSISTAQKEEFQPMTARFRQHLQWKKWGLDTWSSYMSYHKRPWELQQATVERVWIPQWHRLRLGDVQGAAEGFLTPSKVLGVGVDSIFHQTPAAFRESKFRLPITLKRQSEVIVFVNKKQVSAFTLLPGNYTLKHFPLSQGVNKVVVKVIRYGQELQVIKKTVRYDRFAQDAFSNRFSYVVGVPYEQENRLRTLYTSQSHASLSHTYGLTRSIMIGADVGHDTGRDVVDGRFFWISPFGRLSTTLGKSWVQSQQGLGARVQLESYQKAFGRSFFNRRGIRAERYTKGFLAEPGQTRALRGKAEVYLGYGWKSWISGSTGLGVEDTRSTENIHRTLTISQQTTLRLMDSLSLGIDVKLLKGQDELNSNEILGSIKYNPRSPYQVSYFYRHEKPLGKRGHWETGFLVSVALGQTRHKSRVAVNTLDESVEGDYRFRYDGLSAGVNIQRDPLQDLDVNAQLQYNTAYQQMGTRLTANDNNESYQLSVLNPRGQVEYRFNGDKGAENQVTQVRASTAIVFAGRHMSFSRPINGPFAIVTLHPLLKGRNIKGNYNALSDGIAPPVMSGITRFNKQALVIEPIEDMPLSFKPLPESYSIQPFYNQGYVLQVGETDGPFIQGAIQTADIQPYAYKLVIVRRPDGKEFPIFTGKNGGFEILDAIPGIYRMTFELDDVPMRSFVIKEKDIRRHKMDDIVIPYKEQEVKVP